MTFEHVIIAVCLPRHMEGKGMTPIFSYLAERLLESLEHLIIEFLNIFVVRIVTFRFSDNFS